MESHRVRFRKWIVWRGNKNSKYFQLEGKLLLLYWVELKICWKHLAPRKYLKELRIWKEIQIKRISFSVFSIGVDEICLERSKNIKYCDLAWNQRIQDNAESVSIEDKVNDNVLILWAAHKHHREPVREREADKRTGVNNPFKNQSELLRFSSKRVSRDSGNF